MKERRQRVQPRDPKDGIAEPRVNACDGRASVVYKRQRGRYFDLAEQRERVPFEPRSGDRRER